VDSRKSRLLISKEEHLLSLPERPVELIQVGFAKAAGRLA